MARQLQRCCSECPRSPCCHDGSLHTTGGILADSKCANLYFQETHEGNSQPDSEVIREVGKVAEIWEEMPYFHEQEGLEHTNNMHIFPAVCHVTMDKKKYYAHA